MVDCNEFEAPDSADESFLDDLFEDAIACAERGETLNLDARLAGREHLRESAVQTLRLAFEVGQLSATSIELPSIAGFRLVHELGHGSMGSVYLAEQAALGGRRVALKLLPTSAALSTRARQRFLTEARALARVRHPNVVTVHDVIDSGEVVAYAMEWVEGRSLGEILAALRARGAAPRLEIAAQALRCERSSLAGGTWTLFVCHVAIAIARALAAVHAAGLLHRDVKPSNILLRRDGTPLISDFGLVRDEQSSFHTRTGDFLGTPAYSAPEQLRGDQEHVDARSDVYSLGATLYEALTLNTPHPGRSPTEILASAETGAFTPLRRREPRLPRDLETIVAKCLDPDAARRYQTSADLADDLERVLRLEPIRARPTSISARAWKLVRRNRKASGVALALALIAALPAWWIGSRRASRVEQMRRVTELRHQAQEALLDLNYPVLSLESGVTTTGTGSAPQVASIKQRTSAALVAYRAAIALEPSADVVEQIQLEMRVLRFAPSLAARERCTGTETLAESCPLTASAAEGWWTAPRSSRGEVSRASATDRRYLGLLAYLLGDGKTAIDAWSTEPVAEPLDGFVCAALGDLYLERDQREPAHAQLLAAAIALPGSWKVSTLLAEAATRVGDLATAERSLACAEALVGSTPAAECVRVRAALAAARGDDVRARELYESLLKGGGSAADFASYCSVLERAGDVSSALRARYLLASVGIASREQHADLARAAERWVDSLAAERPGLTVVRALERLTGFGIPPDDFLVVLANSLADIGRDAESQDSMLRRSLDSSSDRRRFRLSTLTESGALIMRTLRSSSTLSPHSLAVLDRAAASPRRAILLPLACCAIRVEARLREALARAVAAALIAAPALAVGNEWPSRHGNLFNDRRAAGEQLHTQWQEVWRTPRRGAGVLVSDGIVVYQDDPSQPDRFVGVQLADGAFQWAHTTGITGNSAHLLRGCIVDGRVFLPLSMEGLSTPLLTQRVESIDLHSGFAYPTWDSLIDGDVWGLQGIPASANTPNSRVVFCARDMPAPKSTRIVVLDGISGTAISSLAVPSTHVGGGVAIYPDPANASSCSANVFVHELAWNAANLNWKSATLRIRDLDTLTSQSCPWSASAALSNMTNSTSAGGPSDGPFVAAGSEGYVFETSGTLRCFNLALGQQMWVQPVTSVPTAAMPVVVGSNVLLLDSAGMRAIAFDRITGALQWQLSFPATPMSYNATVLDGGIVLVGLMNGNVYGLSESGLLSGPVHVEPGMVELYAVGGRYLVCTGTELICYRPICAVSTYGTAKTSSIGCVPSIGALGSASASSSSTFTVDATNVINNKQGLLFYGFAPAASPFQGGYLLVANPLRRTPLQNSGGNVASVDCSGTFTFDFNARIQSGADTNLVAGSAVCCQYWYRDPAAPFTTGLSDGLSFEICP